MLRGFDRNLAVDRHHVVLERPDAQCRGRAAAGVEVGRLAGGVDEDGGVDRFKPLAAGDERLAAVGARSFEANAGRDADPARRWILRPDRKIEIMAPIRRDHVGRSEERRVGKARVTCRSRWLPATKKKKNN